MAGGCVLFVLIGRGEGWIEKQYVFIGLSFSFFFDFFLFSSNEH